MNTRSIGRAFGLIAVLAIGGGTSAFAQDGVQNRSIPSDDFAKKRPVRAKAASKPQRFSYKYLRSDKNLIRRANTSVKPIVPNPPKTRITENFTEIGVTVWKLRPPVGSEAGYMMPVQLENKETSMWLAERTGPDAIFSAGDKVRFAVEASVPGYLYVFDRETYSDGTFGDPYLVFPESLAEDNYVGPGLIADIPDQRDEFPYFDINPKKSTYRGELLTVIISPTPIKGFTIDDESKLQSVDRLKEFEFDAETEIFSRDDSADKIYSKTESASACGIKTRQLERVKTAKKPCTNAPRLSTDEPLPQSLYRVKNAAGSPAVIFVKLHAK